jgi:integrase
MSDGRRGSVKQAPSGAWYFVVDRGPGYVGQTWRERRQTRRRGFATRKAAQAALTEVLGQLARAEYVEPARLRLAEYLTDRWLPAIKHTVRASTWHSYAGTLTHNVIERGQVGHVTLQAVDPAMLNGHYELLLSGSDGHRALSRTSVAYVHVILHRAFKDAVRWSLLVRSPADHADPPRAAHRPAQAWSAGHAKAFLSSLDSDRHAAAWRLLLSTGMRRGELLALRWSDVDLDAGRLSITRALVQVGDREIEWSTPKTRAGHRTIAIDPASVGALRGQHKQQAADRLALGVGYSSLDLVFAEPDGSPIRPKNLSARWSAAVRRAGVPRLSLHGARHTWATLALEAGISPKVVQERLGHANVATTLGIYSHVSMDVHADAAAQVARLLGVTTP